MACIYTVDRTAPLNDRVLIPINALFCPTRMNQHFKHDIVLDISFIRERGDCVLKKKQQIRVVT